MPYQMFLLFLLTSSKRGSSAGFIIKLYYKLISWNRSQQWNDGLQACIKRLGRICALYSLVFHTGLWVQKKKKITATIAGNVAGRSKYFNCTRKKNKRKQVYFCTVFFCCKCSASVSIKNKSRLKCHCLGQTRTVSLSTERCDLIYSVWGSHESLPRVSSRRYMNWKSLLG